MEQLAPTPSINRGCALLTGAFIAVWMIFALVYINYPEAF